MEFRVFGPVEACDDVGNSIHMPPMVRALLAVLLVNLGRPMSTREITGWLWGEEQSKLDAYYGYVTQLRRILAENFGDAARLQSVDRALRLDLDHEKVDCHRFKRHFHNAQIAIREERFEAALADLRAGLAEWRSGPLAGIGGGRLDNLRIELESQWLRACQVLVDTRFELGQHFDALTEIDHYRTRWPDDEFLVARRVTAMVHSGQAAGVPKYLRQLRNPPSEWLRDHAADAMRNQPASSSPQPSAIPKAQSLIRPVRHLVSGGADETSLDTAARQLAAAVRLQWEREEELRRVHDPFPLPVRWHAAPTGLTDHWANIARASATALADPVAEGDLDEVIEIHREVRRLVVLGRAGSGKTILVMRLVLKLLEGTDAELVPVIFSLGSWNPARISVRDWLADQLSRDYPGLAARGPAGISLATALVRAGRILPVLDGFDEVADGLHSQALKSLNTLTAPLVVTSRTAQFQAAVAATDVLTNTAGVELDDLTLRDLREYLPNTTTRTTVSNGQKTPMWDPVLARMAQDLESPATRNLQDVLTTPLMVGLARAIYSDTPGHDPAELLDTTRFGTREDVEAHLLNAFVPAVYSHPPLDRDAGPRRYRRWDPDLAQHWLRHLARQLDRLDTRDLLWWQLGSTAPRLVRLAVFAVIGALAAGFTGVLFTMGLEFLLTFGLVAGLMYALTYGLVPGLLVGIGFTFFGGLASRLTGVLAVGFEVRIAVGVVFSLAVGLLFGLLITNEPEPLSLKLRVRGRAGHILRRVLVGLAAGPVVGVTFGFAFDLAGGPSTELGTSIVGGIVGGLMAGPLVGLIGGLEMPIDIRTAISPADLLTSSRKNAVFQSLTIGLVFGAAFGVAFELMIGQVAGFVTGPAVGLIAGIVVGLGMKAWGRWLVVARVWLPLTNTQPWVMIAFLEDAHRRGVLRQAGAVYQFRHARLQDHLARLPG
jgi:DNA-binding SARP family transcriptional activator/GTPase SAR1 family protein